MIQRTFADFQRDPFTRQYINAGDRVLSVMKSAIDENTLIFDNGRGFAKAVKVHDCGSDFVYQIRKKCINARGGAAGLYDFLQREAAYITGGFFLTVCNKVFEYMS